MASLQPPYITSTEPMKRGTFYVVILYVAYVICFHHSLLFKLSSKPPTDYTPTKQMNRDKIFIVSHILPHGMYPPALHHKSSDKGNSVQDGTLGQECAEPEISCRDLLS